MFEGVARLTGLEPATSGVTGRHSNQLSYNRMQAFIKTACERRLATGPDAQRQARKPPPLAKDADYPSVRTLSV